MSKQAVLVATKRDRVGKGASRAARRQGLIPAVIYGDKKTPLPIHINRKQVTKMVYSGGFLTHIMTIEVDKAGINVLPRDYQLDPVKSSLMHVDFLRISKGAVLTVDIPVEFINTEACQGLRRGGVLNIVRHTVELNAPADRIPEKLIFDLTGLEINDTIHMSATQLDEGISPTITDRDFTIATIVAPSGLRSESSEEAAQEEVEAEGEDEDE